MNVEQFEKWKKSQDSYIENLSETVRQNMEKRN